MKNLFQFAGAALLALTMMFTVASCSQDPCVTKKITCANGGTCLDGLCSCVDGYEGDLCADLSRTKFIGTYGAFDEIASISGTNYTTNITGFGIAASSTGDGKVILTKFGGANETVVANVKGKTVTIPDGTVINVTDAGVTVAWTVSAATITNTATGVIKMAYTLKTASGTTATCTVASATRQ